MARSRRGSFGLQPRVAPNVTGQVVALAREYQAKQDSNIMDAWRNGGTFNGKKVTDDMVLSYWQERGKGLDKNDPNYEGIHNNIMQLEYSVAQSKQDLLHAQGKLSDGAYAQFFLKWSNKVPKNSEFYRVLQKDAAGLIEQSKAKARANGERIKTEAFNKFVQDTTASKIAIGDAMTADLDKLSKQTGLSITGNGDELLALLTQDVKANPDGHRALLDTLKKGDPSFTGELTEGYFAKHIKDATQGYELIADKAQKGGFVSAYASATQGMATMSGWGSNVKVWPVSQTYTDLENSFLKVFNDPNASQMDKQAAATAFSGQLSKLAATPGIDPGSKTMMEADAQRLLGQDAGDNPSFGTAMLGRQGVDPKMSMQLGAWAQTKVEMDANPAAWAYAPVDANGQFDVTGKGPLGMVPAGQVQPGAQAVMVPGADGKAVMAMVMPHSVYATDPNDPSASPKLAGHTLDYNVGGKSITLWGYKDANNNPQWSLNSPLAEGSTTQTNNNGDVFVTPGHVTLPVDQQIAGLKDNAGNPIQLSDAERGALLAGGTITTKGADPKKGVGGTKTDITLSVKNGYLSSTSTVNTIDKDGNVTASIVTPNQLAGTTPEGNAFSQSAMHAGDIPGVTFSSPMLASVKAASYTQTQDQVSKFAADPNFQQAFLSQTMQTLGTTNPFDPRIADAWKSITTVNGNAQNRQDLAEFQGKPIPAALRADLRYPGPDFQSKDALNSKLNVNFGNGQTLQIPGLPSYLKDQSIQGPGGGGSAASWLTGSPIGGLLSGLGVQVPSQMPSGSPAGAIKPTTVTPSPTSGTPPPSATPAPTPAPTAAPTPHPVNTWGGGY